MTDLNIDDCINETCKKPASLLLIHYLKLRSLSLSGR